MRYYKLSYDELKEIRWKKEASALSELLYDIIKCPVDHRHDRDGLIKCCTFWNITGTPYISGAALAQHTRIYLPKGCCNTLFGACKCGNFHNGKDLIAFQVEIYIAPTLTPTALSVDMAATAAKRVRKQDSKPAPPRRNRKVIL